LSTLGPSQTVGLPGATNAHCTKADSILLSWAQPDHLPRSSGRVCCHDGLRRRAGPTAFGMIAVTNDRAPDPALEGRSGHCAHSRPVAAVHSRPLNHRPMNTIQPSDTVGATTGIRRQRRGPRLGSHRIGDRDLQTQWRRSARLPHRRHCQNRKRHPNSRIDDALAVAFVENNPANGGA
jgi:hypothetical protein